MLKRLRIRFICGTMVIVTLLLASVFTLLVLFTQHALTRDSLRTMETIAERPPNSPPMPGRTEDRRFPYFTVFLESSGEVRLSENGTFDLEDADFLHTVVSTALDGKNVSGVLREYDLRYYRAVSPRGLCIVFADMTSELSALSSLRRVCLLIGAAAFLVFLGLSVLLARRAVRPVEKAWTQQKQFVADASHELKTPLTVITTDAELLASSECGEEDRRRFSGAILTMAEQMRGLVEELLTLARLDAGKSAAARERLSLSDAVDKAILPFEPLFFESDMPLSSEVEPGIFVNGRADALRRLTEILLDNARKYASPGGATAVTLRRTSPRRCILEVVNEGEPISEADLPHLFERFYRADKARTMDHSYGLGLSIAQSITAEHRGSIRAESRDGKNRFIVEMPTVN